jgi:hypothetical protein
VPCGAGLQSCAVPRTALARAVGPGLCAWPARVRLVSRVCVCVWIQPGRLLSPSAAGVRTTIVAELGRVIDAAAAADVRTRIQQQ